MEAMGISGGTKDNMLYDIETGAKRDKTSAEKIEEADKRSIVVDTHIVGECRCDNYEEESTWLKIDDQRVKFAINVEIAAHDNVIEGRLLQCNLRTSMGCFLKYMRRGLRWSILNLFFSSNIKDDNELSRIEINYRFPKAYYRECEDVPEWISTSENLASSDEDD